jgi:hypothetical protein
MGPGKPPEKLKGTESVRSLGGLWVLCEGHGEMPGGGVATTLMTLGYDSQKKRYVGSWVGSMMTYLWLYEGALDATEKVLTLQSEGPSISGDGKITQYKDVIELQSEDQRVLTSYACGDDGQWQKFVVTHYRRTKR